MTHACIRQAAAGLLLAAVLVAPVAGRAEPGVHVKKAIADTMTPEELADYTAQLAARIAAQPAPGALPADTCGLATYEVSSLPLGPLSDTTVGQTDDYDLPPDTIDPTCTASTSCSGAPSGRGKVYTGTGMGPDRAFRIRTDNACDLTITASPTAAQDLALIVYDSACSNDLGDCACVDDTGTDGVAEVVTLNAVAGRDYFIVIDGYSVGAMAPGPSGTFDLSISGSGCNLIDPVGTTTTTTVETTTTSVETTTTSTTVETTTTSTSLPPGTTTTTVVSGVTTTTTVPGAASGCVGGVPITKAVVKITRLDGSSGDEDLKLAGVLQFAAGVPAGFDPAAAGAQILLEDLGAGASLFDATVPPGDRGTGCAKKDGWKGSRYKNTSGAFGAPSCPAGSAHGLRAMSFTDKRDQGKGLKFAASAKGTAISAPVGSVRLTILTSADASAAGSGFCGTHTFDAGACVVGKKGVTCK